MIKRLPLWGYVTGVLVAWAIVLVVVSRASPAHLNTTVALFVGFLLGMLYMYLRMHARLE